MKRVYKYPIEIQNEYDVVMPKGARVLTVQVQHGRPCLWAAVDPSQGEMERRMFRIAGTGHAIPDECVDGYVGTIQMLDGRLVFHVFEISKP